MMRKFVSEKAIYLLRFFFVCLFLFQTYVYTQSFAFQDGDIIFQVNESTSFTQAITKVTSHSNNYPYTHVGLVVVENDTVYVIEATPPFVSKTLLDSFLIHSMFIDGNPLVTVTRLKTRYQKYIPDAIKRAQTLIGKRYDYVFLPDDDAYYCSELIYACFLNEKGEPLFEAKPMTFKDSTGIITEGWMAHYKIYETQIPEGVEGTNPVDMSESKIIYRVYDFYTSERN